MKRFLILSVALVMILLVSVPAYAVAPQENCNASVPLHMQPGTVILYINLEPQIVQGGYANARASISSTLTVSMPQLIAIPESASDAEACKWKK